MGTTLTVSLNFQFFNVGHPVLHENPKGYCGQCELGHIQRNPPEKKKTESYNYPIYLIVLQ